jgi:hypothetical protein
MPITLRETDSIISEGEAIDLCIKQRESGIKKKSLSKFITKGYKITRLNNSGILKMR